MSMGQSEAGGQQVTVRLNPAELGMVQVRVDRDAAGVASVSVTAERPETLQTLVRDQAQLHRVLDAAGVPSVGRTLTFSLAADTQVAATAATGPAQVVAHGAGAGQTVGQADSGASWTGSASGGLNQGAPGQGGLGDGGQSAGRSGGQFGQDQSGYRDGRPYADRPPPPAPEDIPVEARQTTGISILA